MLSSLSSSISNARQSIAQVLNFALVLSTAFMMWKGLSVLTASSSPIVVVLSGSMEPAFQRGDLLFLWARSPRVEIGEVVVYNVRGKDIPIVHRVVRTYPEVEGRASAKKVKEITVDTTPESHMLLTKGDNNLSDDTELYARDQDYLDRKEDIVGSVRGYIPMVGYVTIMLSEHPWLKTVMLGLMGLMVILQRDLPTPRITPRNQKSITMGSIKRISKELGELTESPPEGITVTLADGENVYNWNVYMDGPEDSPYHNGKFLVKLTLPTEYPFKPPTVSFATKIYHPNVTNDDKGSMCLGMLRPDEWKPSSKIAAVLQFARQLLSEPMPDDAVESRIADQYKNDRGAYDATAREWTRKHAHAKPT
ncbi:ubiquitin-conjugating enzyme/RWD-like protein [Penicillium soppii]|uniref:ubiquitin-conjugating enzyme/RWD-like protein n=1 Tax=Penicillium soppii TaxID=69789 RepID=UPI002546F17F|nr:ubiquitin-conjugating enzyme/RWD-like protein [Penicillium soppii]KAJ5861320.1 ubiquitin-conjugating enzyme/RWD-like protein [Penicillium soppii]